MSAKEDKQPDIHKNPWYMTVSKIAFFVIAFLIVIFTVLANIKGNNDTFKKAVEDYVAGVTGYHARVGTLNHAALFPNIIFDFEDLELRQSESDTTPVASVEYIQMKLGFFDIVSGSGKFRDLNIEGLKAIPGVILSKAVTMDVFTVEDKDDGSAILKAKGSIGADSYYAQSDIDVFGKGKKVRYGFGGKRHISVNLGTLSANAEVYNGEISNFKLSLQDQDVVTGHLNMSDKKRGFEIKGSLKLAGQGTSFEPDFIMSKSRVKGTLVIPALYVEDFGSDSLLGQAMDEMKRILVGDVQKERDISLSHDMDVVVEIGELHVGKGNLGPLSIPVKIKDGALNVALNGKFAEGDLSGNIKLDAKELPASLDIDVALNKLDYGALQKNINESAQVTGTGDLLIKVKSKGRNASGLAEGLNGQFTFVGGQGAFNSGAVNLWGGGLVNAIMPNISAAEELGVNCAIMDFKIEDGVANAQTLFLDGKHVTLAGEGSYSIAKDNLDISIKPKSKGMALGSIATSIKITGPVGNPSIGPSLLDFGAKIGGLLLGVVNPAFLAFSLTDLGLNEEHPCAAFIEAPQNAPQEEAAQQ